MKRALITGGTSGVGLSIVRHLAGNGYQVYFIGTNAERGKEIENELNGHEIQFIQLDLSHTEEVQKFIENFSKEHERLDLLVNTAGVLLPSRQTTKAGIEKSLAIGYLSAYLFCDGFIPLLKKSIGARIVNVAGNASIVLKERLNFEDLNFNENYSGIQASFAAVHAKTVYTKILGRKLKDEGINVIAFHPGFVRSNLTRNLPRLLQFPAKIMNQLLPRVSKSGIQACTSDRFIIETGVLLEGKKIIDINFSGDYEEQLMNATKGLLRA